jgi:alkylhydroperoxidase/carboxymuconolactone decarboxylase family protein YurZ
VLRLTGSERALVEVAAIAEHVASLTAAAAAFRLRPDVPVSPESGPEVSLVPLLDEARAPGAAETFAEIRAWTRQTLGLDSIPAIWRALAHQPGLLDATWRKDRLVLEAGALDVLVKSLVALAVAQLRESVYWIPYYTHVLRRRCGLDDAAVVEVAGTVMHYVSFNTIAHGMRLEPPVSGMTAADVAPGGPLEHIVPPGARRPPSNR